MLDVRNLIARRLGRPPGEHLELIHASIHAEYLRPFSEATELEKRFWMRFRNAEDLAIWFTLIVPELPSLVERARGLPAHELLLGEQIVW